MSAPGFYRQNESGLINKFFRITRQGASQVKNNGVSRRRLASESLKSARTLALSIGREAVKSNFGYTRRLRSQLKTIANRYSGYGKITVPVVLVQAENDLLSDPERTLPGYKNKSQSEREAELQKTIFQESPYVRMIVGRKNGIHTMPYLRSREVARVALHMLARSERVVTKK